MAVACFSTSSVLVLWAAPLSAYEITFGRLAVGTGCVLLAAKLSGQPLWPKRSDLLRFTGIGLVTALHFLCFNAAFRFTTIAHALAITYTAPLFVTLFSAWLLNERVPRRKWAGCW